MNKNLQHRHEICSMQDVKHLNDKDLINARQ